MEALKIIVADNHPVFRTGMEMIIKKINESFHVFHAANGLEILEIIKYNTVNFVFMDIRMPGMDGIETTYRLKKSNPEMKIIALSTMAEKYDVLKMFKAGANGYLLKNASLEKIEMAFRTLIKGENYFTEEIRCFFSGKICEKFKVYLDKSLRQELT
ncbi:MAG TPA: response regulator transcription factor, partial [Bacteroidia bacterium]|nr:response regulator transcription factor [Bacteroidia bacterium]